MEIVETDPQVLNIIYYEHSLSAPECHDNETSSVCTVGGCDHSNSTPYNCSFHYCEEKFASKIDLDEHVTSHYSIIYKDQFVCPESGCNRTFSTQYGWKVHQNSHKVMLALAVV